MRFIKTSGLVALLLMIFSQVGSAQRIILEPKINIEKYEDAIRHEGGVGLYLGYEVNDILDIGLEVEGNVVTHDIRLKDRNVSSPNWGGILFNVLTVSNNADWSKTEKKEVYKGYTRELTSFRLLANFYTDNNLRFSLGATIQRNRVLTEPTDEVTFRGSLFSDLEFDTYSNLALGAGLDYINSFNSWSYFFIGVDLESDIYSSSSKIRDSDYMGLSINYNFGIGLRIGKTKTIESPKMERRF